MSTLQQLSNLSPEEAWWYSVVTIKRDDQIFYLKQQGLLWSEISDRLSGRNCRDRYLTHVIKNDGRGWRWTASEDRLISAFVRQTTPNWDILGNHIRARTAGACRRRNDRLIYAPVGHEEGWTEDKIEELKTLHSEVKNWFHIWEGLTTTTIATNKRRRTAGECLRRWLHFHDAFPYPGPVASPLVWTPERKQLAESLRRAGETWEHICKRVLISAAECRTFWYKNSWEDYRLWMNKHGELNRSGFEERPRRAETKIS